MMVVSILTGLLGAHACEGWAPGMTPRRSKPCRPVLVGQDSASTASQRGTISNPLGATCSHGRVISHSPHISHICAAASEKIRAEAILKKKMIIAIAAESEPYAFCPLPSFLMRSFWANNGQIRRVVQPGPCSPGVQESGCAKPYGCASRDKL